jgi:hypothetical protein
MNRTKSKTNFNGHEITCTFYGLPDHQTEPSEVEWMIGPKYQVPIENDLEVKSQKYSGVTEAAKYSGGA